MFWDLNLLRLFDFYLALAFLVGTYVRIRQYEAIVRLVRAVPGRWPRLFDLVRQHHTIFLTWSTALPALFALGLSVVHTLACRLVWPHAHLHVAQLAELWPAVPVLLLTGGAMVALDVYCTFTVGAIDRPLLEKYFDQAEYWLRSWAAPVVKVFTFGYVNPREMVAVEVRKALLEASQLLNSTLWWVSGQVGLRIAFGLSLWLTYATGRVLDKDSPPGSAPAAVAPRTATAAVRSWGILPEYPLTRKSLPSASGPFTIANMTSTILLRRGTPVLATCLLVCLTASAGAWELGGPLYTSRLPPASWYGYNLDDPSPSYFGGGRYREYYSYGRGAGLALFPGPFPDYPWWTPHRYPPPYAVPAPGPLVPPPPVARLTVHVPAGAELWIEGKKSEQTEAVRRFVSPPLAAGQQYTFTIRARWGEGARAVEQVQHVLVSAGRRFDVTFPTPAPGEMLPAPRAFPAKLGP